MRFANPLVWLAAAMIVACSQGGPAKERDSQAPDLLIGKARYATILEAPPRTPIPRLAQEPYTRTLDDRRFFFADRIEQRNLPLLRRIKSEQMGNFGGVEWRWRDGPENAGLGRLTGIVHFLRAPEATLARYTRDPLFRAAKGDFARTEQERIAVSWANRIGAGIPTPEFSQIAYAEFGNMRVPRLRIAMPKREYETRAKGAGWSLPSNLQLWFDPMADPDLPSVSPDIAPLIRAFPQQPRLSGPTPDIATYDAVVLRDGCFFIDQEGDEDPLVEFPFSVGVFRDAEGHLSFRTRYSERPRVLGRVGTRLQLGYRSQVRETPPALRKACGGKTMVSITSAEQAAGYGPDWSAVKQYRDRHGLTSAEALRQANTCLLEQERVLADRRLRGSRAQRPECVMTLVTAPPPPPPAPASSGSPK